MLVFNYPPVPELSDDTYSVMMMVGTILSNLLICYIYTVSQ